MSRTPVREALLRLDMRAVRDARDVVAAMHEVAVRWTGARRPRGTTN